MITHEVTEISPEEAKGLLGMLYHKQRPVMQQHVERIAQDIENGVFRLSPDPIVILESGHLANGQHRLRACVKTGRHIPLVISRGWPEGTYEIMDAGKVRSLMHRISVPYMKRAFAIAAIRQTMVGVTSRTGAVSEMSVVAAGVAWEKDASWLFTQPFASQLRASILAVCLRALLRGEDSGRIARFVAVVGSGLGDGEREAAAVRLYAYVQSQQVKKQNGQAAAVDVYKKTQTALRAFLKETPLPKLYPVDEDLWPLKTHEEIAAEQLGKPAEF